MFFKIICRIGVSLGLKIGLNWFFPFIDEVFLFGFQYAFIKWLSLEDATVEASVSALEQNLLDPTSFFDENLVL